MATIEEDGETKSQPAGPTPTTLDPHAGHVTVINTYVVDPENAQAVLDYSVASTQFIRCSGQPIRCLHQSIRCSGQPIRCNA